MVGTRKNVLYLTNRLPFPADKGDKIRTFHQVDHLALSHNVYCACFVDSAADLERVSQLNRWCKDVVAVPWNKGRAALKAGAGFLSGRAITQSAYRDRGFEKALGRWTKDNPFDACIAFSSMMAPYALKVPARRRVLDLCDVDSEKWFDYARAARLPMSAVYRLEAKRLRRLEMTYLDKFDATFLITQRERRLLDPHGDRDSIHVLPNGTVLSDRVAAPVSRTAPLVGFLGSMDYKPNVDGVCWFVRHVWPAVIREVPDARMLIVGRNPTRSVRRLAGRPGVTVTGAVRDPLRYLVRCRVVVAPLRIARGLQNKVLEAMSVRRPVVATSAVASSMRVEPGRNILVADDPREFAARVSDLCRYEAYCRQVGDAGYRCVAAHYCWPEVLHRFEQIVFGNWVQAAQKMPTHEAMQRMHRNSVAMRSQATQAITPTDARTAVSAADMRV